MQRYFAFLWDPADTDSSSRIASIQSALLSSPPWRLAYGNDGALVVHEPLRQRSASVHALADLQGVVIGSLYRRTIGDSAARPAEHLDDMETRHIVTSGGRHLVRNYWGTYVAIVYDRKHRACSVMRDPTGNLACFHANVGNFHVFFSDMEDFTRYVTTCLSINWRHIAARLLAGFVLSRESAVNELEDIPGGECVTISAGGEDRRTLWHPGRFCTEDSLEEEGQACRELRSCVLGVVRTLASEHETVMALLSGGLDSSIVTSCLSQAPRRPEVACLNFYATPDSSAPSTHHTAPGLDTENAAKVRRVAGSADEREYARRVARRCGFRLLETPRRVGDLDFPRIYQAPLAPRPSGYAFLADEDKTECESAVATRATACFTGQGGDSVFYATLRAIGALDYAYLHPFGPRLIRQLFLTAASSRESLPHVLAKVVKYGYLRLSLPPAFQPMKRPNLLKDDAVSSVPNDYFRHPWLDAAPRLCPGKHNHVLGVTHSVPLYHNIYHRERIAPSVHPLASQPVVETCLRIPTYVLLADGISRGLARRAFRDLLPAEVLRRTVKGSGVRFYQNIVRRNIGSLRERLLDGVLVREGLLDRDKLERYLTADQVFLTVQAEQILDYTACEAWVTQVTAMRDLACPCSADKARAVSPTAHIESPCPVFDPPVR